MPRADSSDDITTLVARLTKNGAINLRGTINHPSVEHPLAINGVYGIYTGSGKWTSVAATAVERHLVGLGLAVRGDVSLGDGVKQAMVFVTPLGLRVARYLVAHWPDLPFRN